MFRFLLKHTDYGDGLLDFAPNLVESTFFQCCRIDAAGLASLEKNLQILKPKTKVCALCQIKSPMPVKNSFRSGV
jgi:hypothetical protein